MVRGDDGLFFSTLLSPYSSSVHYLLYDTTLESTAPPPFVFLSEPRISERCSKGHFGVVLMDGWFEVSI